MILASKRDSEMSISKFSTVVCVAFFFGSAIATDFRAGASLFVQHYYKTFDENRANLAMFYVSSLLIRF